MPFHCRELPSGSCDFPISADNAGEEGNPPPSECFMDGSCSVLFIVKPVTSTSQTSPTATDIAPVRPSKETLSQEIWGGQDRAALVNLITTKM